MKLMKQFLASIDCAETEELLDLFCYRPVAFGLVQIFCLIPVTPNQITVSAIAVGWVGAYCFSLGDTRSMAFGGILYALANVLDCCDGMVARIKKNGTPYGRILDGLADALIVIAIYIGFAWGLLHAATQGWLSLNYNPFILMVVAGLGTAVHCMLSDKYRNLYKYHVQGKRILPQQEIQQFEEERERLKRIEGQAFSQFVVNAYLFYSKLQTGKKPAVTVERADPDLYRRYNRWTVLGWNLIGPTTHISVLALSAFLYRPEIFFWYSIGFANLWMLIMFALQAVIDAKIDASA